MSGRASDHKKNFAKTIMASGDIESRDNARAFPVGDALGPRLTPPKNWQGLPSHGRAGLKRQAQRKMKDERMRVGTLNVGTMTGKGRELVDLMERRKLGVLCVQETRWKGNKARELGEGCKLFYSGANEEGRNGVGIILSKEIKESLLGVSRKNDRIMSLKLGLGATIINIVCAYAPQTGCTEEEKDAFWEEMDQELRTIPVRERIIIGGDLNGHLGISRAGISRVHGGWGVGERNEGGERVIDFAVAFDLALINTFFEKKMNRLITYSSGGRESQIDLLLCKRDHLVEIRNCKVINGESVAAQHRMVVIDCLLRNCRKSKKAKMDPKIKWWKLKDTELRVLFKERVLEAIRLHENVQEWWTENSKMILRIGEEVLGKSSGRKPPNDKESWWWNDEVQGRVKSKKEAKKKADLSGLEQDKEEYKQAKKEASRAVAKAMAETLNEVYEELETAEGEKKILRIAKARDTASKDLTQIRQIKDGHGIVLAEENEIKRRWETYFERLLNEENPRMVFEDGIPNEAVTSAVTRREVKQAVRKMKNGKAAGPDNIPVEVWKSLGEEGIDILWDLMQKIFNQEKMPEEWRGSLIIPIYKGKGDIQECGNYRGIKLISHTMKIWEKIIEKRIRDETTIGEEQFGFMPGRGTADAIFALRQMMEKHREKQEGLHMVFIDLEKAYDRVPRQEVWRCMREKGVPEKYVRITQDMYERAEANVKSSVGLTESFPVNVGLHQGSALSPYLFDLVMDVVSQGIRDQSPWCMLFADDIVLCSTRREVVEEKLEEWRREIEGRGLKISRKKTEYLRLKNSENGEVSLQGEVLKRVENFKYLGSTVADDGELGAEITHRIQAGWKNWKKVSGVLCDKRIGIKLKGKVHKTVVRPAMMYGAETWAIKKTEEKKLDVAEMRMLRWMCGVTRKDKIRNEVIRGTTKVRKISDKIQESRLRWYGHVMRRDEQYVGRRVMEMDIRGRRRRGRPKRRWMDCVKDDLRSKGLTGDEVWDRSRWRTLARNIDPT